MIEGGALTVPLLNETEWHVSEIAVALTVIRKPTTEELEESESHTEKRPDETVIYRMRAAAVPWATTVFSAPESRDCSRG